MTQIARVLIIAGSDSGGGAGIQADIKTATVLGAYAMTAITAVTVQDTTGVHAFHTVPPDIVAGQIRVVLSDIGADAIKTGMMASAEIVETVVGALASYAAIPLVVDTVMIAKGGSSLVDDSGVEAMKRLLIPRATLITPNAPEAARLTGLEVETQDDLVRAGKKLMEQGARAVLVKGGHLAGDHVTDVLVDSTGVHLFRTRRIETTSTHGTGCTLATAIAAGLAQGLSLEDAVARARNYLQDALRGGLALGRGTGPLNHMHAIPPYEA
ncbi:MAG: bifunctional hydroxymethylpyrimidine kinase/phosphomethylpyrimidine kinase [Alphaproteobacteria bacterium]|nr:bifunctional hydroxymethylpyrimidine kinase/phosphomethylpyrimidine kinase [Alphaproteobacteria bacterium]